MSLLNDEAPRYLKPHPQEISFELTLTKSAPKGISFPTDRYGIVVRTSPEGKTAYAIPWGVTVHHLRHLLERSPEARQDVVALLGSAEMYAIELGEDKYTARGFAFRTWKDRYGEQCSIQESSLATERCIWLGVDEADVMQLAKDARPDDPNATGWVNIELPDTAHVASRMHLTQAMAAALIPALQHFVETGHLPQPPEAS